MTSFRYYLILIIATLTRFFPLPTRTGIVKIGNPTPDSPVLVTGNYTLTVEILKKELRGLDLYLLVANSKGINIWCAATGGHFTNHSIISILKTSGISDLVNHRNYILPQLAATGIETKVIKKVTSWKGIWGPVYASDIKQFLNSDHEINKALRMVKFPLGQRIEMALAWAFLMTVLIGIPLSFFSINATLSTVILIWYISLVTFLCYPLFERWLQEGKENLQSGLVFLRTKILIPLAIAIVAFPVYLLDLTLFQMKPLYLVVIPILGLLVIVMIMGDLKGSTPTYKSDLIPERVFEIKINESLCRGHRDCETVCPKNCFDFHPDTKKVTIPRAIDCVQCGACVVQCPFDALYFENHAGEVLTPDILRAHKLNLMGKRAESSTSTVKS